MSRKAIFIAILVLSIVVAGLSGSVCTASGGIGIAVFSVLAEICRGGRRTSLAGPGSLKEFQRSRFTGSLTIWPILSRSIHREVAMKMARLATAALSLMLCGATAAQAADMGKIKRRSVGTAPLAE